MGGLDTFASCVGMPLMTHINVLALFGGQRNPMKMYGVKMS